MSFAVCALAASGAIVTMMTVKSSKSAARNATGTGMAEVSSGEAVGGSRPSTRQFTTGGMMQ